MVFFIRCLAAVCASLSTFWAPHVFAAKPSLVVEVLPIVSIEKPVVEFHEIANVYAPRELRKSISQLKVSIPSALVARDVFVDRELEDIISGKLEEKGVAFYEVLGPSRVLNRKRVTIDKDRLRKAAAEYLYEYFKDNYPSIKIRGYQPTLSGVVIQDNIDMRVIRMDKPYSSHCVWADVDDRVYRECFDVRVMAEVFLADRDIKIDEQLKPLDVKNVLIDVAALKHGTLTHSDLAEGVLVNHDMQRDQPIFEDSVRKRSPVSRSSTVELVSQVGAVSIVTQAVALDDGEIGEKVRVKMEHSEVELVGVVKESNIVLVSRGSI